MIEMGLRATEKLGMWDERYTSKCVLGLFAGFVNNNKNMKYRLLSFKRAHVFFVFFHDH